jgi:hypothetical protein
VVKEQRFGATFVLPISVDFRRLGDDCRLKQAKRRRAKRWKKQNFPGFA